VAGVKVAPEYRGQGVGRALMTALVDLMTMRGYPLAVLFPATMTIYRSLGWEIAGHLHEAVLPSRALGTLPRADVKAAGIRRAGPDDAAEVLEVIGRAHAGARDCGPVSWDETTMRRWLTRPGTYADRDRYAYLAPDGFLAYHWRHGHDEIFVDRLVASAATAATAALWAVAGSNSSVAEMVRALVGPSDPLWWMLREQDANIAERQSWMLRLLDAPAAIAARGFPATDLAVPLQLTDDLRPANAGRWDLTVRAGTGRLSPGRTSDVPASADPASPAGPALDLGPRGLAALYAGTPMATLRRAGLATGGSPAADAALDGAFAATPYMLDDF
jgi:predicted acetyltransferase